MSDFDTFLQNYVELAVRIGVNVQPGQTLILSAPISAAEVVRLTVEKAYEAGAKHVYVEWADDIVARKKYELAPDDAFDEAPAWLTAKLQEQVGEGAAFLHYLSANPDLFEGIDPDRIARATKTLRARREPYYRAVMADKVSWSILSIPNEQWAAKVFPNVPESERLTKLWDAVFQATRADAADPVAAWNEHLSTLKTRADCLNEKRYKALHYRAPGTDLTVELADGHLWVSGESFNEQGSMFVANMPTEEVFTAPKKTGVNGTVASTYPLNYGGSVIEGLALTFKDGQIVDFKADKGYETLKRMLERDEGSKYLGEVALVPHRSPISDTGLVFYETLFDENASNHLAIGNAYAFCLEGGKSMSKEELETNGLNQSMTHVDFMIGSPEMDIDGITADGAREPIFRGGNWAEA